MSSSGSGHSTHPQSDSAQSSSLASASATHHSSSRKRNSPNTGAARKETQATQSIAAVGSTSSKLRKLAHSSANQIRKDMIVDADYSSNIIQYLIGLRSKLF
ncbi:unnamed protein product [Anisakis simplex]|uniref:Uncharacterized protein n=1 Tax=Anisakis simplex TaxID=6269 RepID=A0A0M3KJX1_ANISI|nr:unnamed protein product [Anisakis simplex]